MIHHAELSRPQRRGHVRKAIIALITGGLVFGAALGGSQAADVNVRMLGWNAGQPQQDKLERPFWRDAEKRTNGMFAVNFRTLDEVGLKGNEALRTLQSGAFDVVAIQVGFVGGDDPFLLASDLPVVTTFDELDKVNAAFWPVLDKRLHERYKAKLVALWSYPPQILFCKGDVSSLADLKGKKIRAPSAFAAKAVVDLGGTQVTLAGPEVYQALLQGVTDCAITGSQYAAANGWYEVAQKVFTLPIGGNGVAIHVALESFWNRLTEEQKTKLMGEFAVLQKGLNEMRAETHQDGMNCNTGRDPCSTGKKGSMKIVEVTADEKAKWTEVLRTKLLPAWLGDCQKTAPTCREEWNNSIGKIVGIQM